jgi:hypothetical protein
MSWRNTLTASKSQGEEGPNLQAEIAPLRAETKDEVLKEIVTASAMLNAAPEKGMLHGGSPKLEVRLG